MVRRVALKHKHMPWWCGHIKHSFFLWPWTPTSMQWCISVKNLGVVLQDKDVQDSEICYNWCKSGREQLSEEQVGAFFITCHLRPTAQKYREHQKRSRTHGQSYFCDRPGELGSNVNPFDLGLLCKFNKPWLVNQEPPQIVILQVASILAVFVVVHPCILSVSLLPPLEVPWCNDHQPTDALLVLLIYYGTSMCPVARRFAVSPGIVSRTLSRDMPVDQGTWRRP